MMVMKKPNSLIASGSTLSGQKQCLIKLEKDASPTKNPGQDEAPAEYVHQQQHIGETLEEKKRRLFKWQYYEKV